MAKTSKPAAPDETLKNLEREANSRLQDARGQKDLVVKDLQESYFFTRPRLSRDVSSRSAPSKRIEDVDDLATGIGPEVSEDFATELISAFFPQNVRWAESTAEAAVLAGIEENSAEMNDLKKLLPVYDATVFAAINASNFNAELATSLDPDASLGTVAWWIDAPGGGRPYRAEHVPTRELEFNVGPDGEIDDRFRVRHVTASKIRSVLPDQELPVDVERKIQSNSKAKIEIAWGFWRDWSKPHDDDWIHVLLVDRKLVHHTTLSGFGCLPLIIARLSPDKLHAWGNGPAIKSLQEFRILDVITAATQDHVDLALSPPFAYPDDGILNFEGGLESGKGYPKRPGQRGEIEKLYFGGDADLGFYTVADLEKKVRRKFFADYPEQRGDTPPSATQWMDEMVRSQRRIGTPGLKFWREGPYEVFRRFEYLLDKDGKLDPIEVNGSKITVTPNNPATQAQDAQKLQTAGNLLNAFKGYFPMTSQAAINERATMDKMKSLSKDEVIVLRDEQETNQLVQGILSQMGGGAGGPEGGDNGAS